MINVDIVKKLIDKKVRITTMESCTGEIGRAHV